MYKLPKHAVRRAIENLVAFGDTDVFPHLPELRFAKDNIEELSTAISEIDLVKFENQGALEALNPKSKLGFRICHQLHFLDTILLTACVVEIGEKIERRRRPFNEMSAFSYRFDVNGGSSIYHKNRTFKEWLGSQQDTLKSNLKFKQVVVTDISDFYARINFHRLENLLDEVAPGHGAANFIKREIKAIRAKQSFGLPVGGAAARLLAELSLTDVDDALVNDGIYFTRFVDDYRMFLSDGQDPYDCLSLLAEVLSIAEGLSLNSAKTSTMSRSDYLEVLDDSSGDIVKEAQGTAIAQLTSSLYFGDEEDIDEEELEELSHYNLLSILQEELSEAEVDFGRVKVIFRALKIVRPENAVQFIRDNISELVIFSREVVLLMSELDREYPASFEDMTDEVIELITSPPANTVQGARTWLLELFVRGIVTINVTDFKKLESLKSAFDQKQIQFARARAGDVMHFRKGKSSWGSLQTFCLPAFYAGCTCLPRDEFKAIGPTVTFFDNPKISELYVKWISSNRKNALALLTDPAE